MKYLNYYSKWIISITTVLLGVLAILSHDPYKKGFAHMISLLKDIEVHSYQLDDNMLSIRGGFSSNYDDITTTARELNELSIALQDYIASDEKASKSIAFSLQSVIGGVASSPLTLNTSFIDDFIVKRLRLIDQFKTNFSIYRNSENLAMELVLDIRNHKVQTNDFSLASELMDIENDILRLIRHRSISRSQEIIDKIETVKQATADEHVAIRLEYLKLHTNNIKKYAPEIDRIIKEDIKVTRLIELEIHRLENELKQNYQQFYQSLYKFQYALLGVAAFLLLFSAHYSRKALVFSRLLKEQNEELEARVEQRTEDLKGMLIELKDNAYEKEQIILDMQHKDQLLAEREEFFRAITQTATDPIIIVDDSGIIRFCNSATGDLLCPGLPTPVGRLITSILDENCSLSQLLAADTPEVYVDRDDESQLALRLSINEIELGHGKQRYAIIVHDLSEYKQLESELANSQKLESVGQLASGIAHEINTPAQFIADNLTFLIDGIDDMLKLTESMQQLAKTDQETYERFKALTDSADLEYLSEEIPSALAQSKDGIDRVANIVRAMKAYAHTSEDMDASDINTAVRSTATVSTGEWKYHADLELDLDENIPLVECNLSDLNQVVLNMIVNAAHAISDRANREDSGSNYRGKITVKTYAIEDYVCIDIQDNGMGMSNKVKQRIFDHFFTTKPVGIGSGQGLSIARKLIVEKHQGLINVDSAEEKGTTFSVMLPLSRQLEQDESQAIAC